MKSKLLSFFIILLAFFSGAAGARAESDTIVINGCDTAVTDKEYNQSLISELIAQCFADACNHGKFVYCVSRLTNDLKKAEIISGQEKGAIQRCVAKKPDTILFNGIIYSMEDSLDTAEAILIEKNRIGAIGTNQQILAMADSKTDIIDLEGKAVFPGFLDPHTHLFNDAAAYGLSLDDAQQLALENGITAVSNMFTNPNQTEDYIRYAAAGNLRLRLHLYLIYNDSCGDVWGTWYESYAPKVEHAPKLWVNGVKIFSEKSVCGEEGVKPVFSPALLDKFTDEGLLYWGENQLLLSLEDLTEVIRRADELGYQIAIHAIGDKGIQTSLEAINSVLQGSNNINRHMILHNHFIRDEMLTQYSDIIALVEPPSPCQANGYAEIVGDDNRPYFKRWHDLVDSAAHVALNSDWPYTGFSGLDSMRKLYAVVNGKNSFDFYEPQEPCIPDLTDQTVSVWQGLKMMTIEAAYAMHRENQLGSIVVGKLADVVVLSQDPLAIDPNEIKTIQVLMTMVDGKIEYWNEDWL